jgi:hypothetical protein
MTGDLSSALRLFFHVRVRSLCADEESRCLTGDTWFRQRFGLPPDYYRRLVKWIIFGTTTLGLFFMARFVLGAK